MAFGACPSGAGARRIWPDMWLAEFIFLLVFFVSGSVTPTAQSDAVARRRNVEDRNRLKREAIRRANEDFRIEYPMYAQVYTVSIGTFFLGAVLVLVWAIPGLTFMIALGYVVQVLSLCVFVVCALKKRKYVVSEPRAKGLGRNSGRGR